MPWVSIGASVGGSLISGALGGGGSKKAERAARDAAAKAGYLLESARNNANANLAPFMESGTAANQRLAELLGIANPRGYDVQRPTRDQFEAQVRNEHFQRFGQDYRRDSNMGWVAEQVDSRYQKALDEWERGLEAYKQANAGWENEVDGFGSLLKNFTNEDFVKDPGYEFRLSEGEKGIDRAASSRGGYDSGSTLKALARYNQDYASNEFGNAYNRDAANKGRIYSFLSGTSNAGQGAASTMAGFTQNAANQQGQNSMNAAQLAGQYQMQGANAWNNAIQGGIGNAIYAYERNKPVTGYGGYTYGSSGQTYGSGGTNPWYLS